MKRIRCAPTSLLSLPNEILLEMYLFVPVFEGCFALSICCRRLHELSEHDSIWRSHCTALFRPAPRETPKRGFFGIEDTFPYGTGDGPERVLPVAYELCNRNWKNVFRKFGGQFSTHEWCRLMCSYARVCIVPTFGDYVECHRIKDYPLPDADDSTKTIFGGNFPFLIFQKDTWPKCPICANSLKFILQVSTVADDSSPSGLRTIASRLGENSLLQLFKCDGCDPAGGGSSLNPTNCTYSRLVREISEKKQEGMTREQVDGLEFVSKFPWCSFRCYGRKTVTGWEVRLDFPHKACNEVFDTLDLTAKRDRMMQDEEEGSDDCPFEDVIAEGKFFGWPYFCYTDKTTSVTCESCKKYPLTNVLSLPRLSGYEPGANIYFCEACDSDDLQLVCC